MRLTLPESFWLTDCDRQLDQWKDLLFGAPNSQALVVQALVEKSPDWPMDQHDQAVREHLRLRSKKSGFRFPRRFDAGIVLELAERYRATDMWERAAECLALVCDNFPEYSQLRALKVDADPHKPIRWLEILAPKLEASQ